MGLYAWLMGENENSDDKTVADAHEFFLGKIADKDHIALIEDELGREIRDLSVEEARDLYEEIRLRRFGAKRN